MISLCFKILSDLGIKILFILYFFFFFNDTATTEIYTLSLHDALPSSASGPGSRSVRWTGWESPSRRSEEHTSELQSQFHLVCRLLLEKKKKHDLSHLQLKKKKTTRRQKTIKNG